MRAGLGRARLSVSLQRGLVVLVGQHPHVVAATIPREISQSHGQRRANAAPAVWFVDCKFVEEHLCAFVWMCQLDAADETGRLAVHICDENVVVWVGQEAMNRSGLGRSVEKVTRLDDQRVVARTQPLEFDVRPPG